MGSFSSLCELVFFLKSIKMFLLIKYSCVTFRIVEWAKTIFGFFCKSFGKQQHTQLTQGDLKPRLLDWRRSPLPIALRFVVTQATKCL